MNNEGGCDMEFSGEDMIDVAGQCGKHVASSTDELHRPMRDKMAHQMAHGTKEDQAKWFTWFKGLWDARSDA